MEPAVTESAVDPRVKRLGGLKLLGIHLLALLLRTWMRTLRFRYGPGDREAAHNTGQPLVIVLWHNRILVTSEIKRRCRMGRPTHGMVSASRDGAYLAAFFEAVGIRTVRGSSSKRGLAAAREALAVLQSGAEIALTPDGPRGPLYAFHEGASMLAQLARTRLLLLSPNFTSAWRVNAWDGLYIPKPFSRVEIRARIVEPEELPRGRTECGEWVRNALLAMTVDLPAPPRARQQASQ
jgi:hypothetical protein